MTDDELESLLVNWARFVRDRERLLNHCLSAEWRWDSRQWHGTYGDLDSPPTVGRIEAPDIKRALMVERAIRRNKDGYSLPLRFRRVLVGKYVLREKPKAIVRKARIDIRAFGDVLNRARQMVRNRLLFFLSKGR